MEQAELLYDLAPGETVTVQCKELAYLNAALKEKRCFLDPGSHVVILLHDNAYSHIENAMKQMILKLKWEFLAYAAYL